MASRLANDQCQGWRRGALTSVLATFGLLVCVLVSALISILTAPRIIPNSETELKSLLLSTSTLGPGWTALTPISYEITDDLFRTPTTADCAFPHLGAIAVERDFIDVYLDESIQEAIIWTPHPTRVLDEYIRGVRSGCIRLRGYQANASGGYRPLSLRRLVIAQPEGGFGQAWRVSGSPHQFDEQWLVVVDGYLVRLEYDSSSLSARPLTLALANL